MAKILLIALAILLTPSYPADAFSAVSIPSLTEAAKARVCAKVRALVARHGMEEAIRMARRRGFSEAQISAASVCL